MTENIEPKKLFLIYILKILTDYSDSSHKMKQSDIIRILKQEYNVDCNRKSVARNIDYLNWAGYDIVTEKYGSYLRSRKFENGELRLLIDSVLSNRNVCKKHTRDLIKKLSEEGGKYFKPYAPKIHNLDDWQKSDKSDLILNVELICEAIDKNKKIKFRYNQYGLDKKLHAKRQTPSKASPYKILLKNDRYYLCCNYDGCDNMIFCRIDRMTDISVCVESSKKILDMEGYEDGINWGLINNRLPYMFYDNPEQIEFIANENLINDVIDWFGFDFSVLKMEDGKVKFSLIASPRAMRFWILQYGRLVKLLSPQSLVDVIKSDINEMQKMYSEEENDK